MSRNRIRFALTLVALSLVVAGIGTWTWCRRGLPQARAYARYELWPEVHQAVRRYLWIHPSDSAANLLCAEALVKDERLPLERRSVGSLARLQRIPDTAPEWVAARIAEARVELFLQCRPGRAEQILHRAIELDPDSFEPYYLLWKLFDLTGRSELAEPFFWKTYELGPAEFRPVYLREWYMSQFYPASASAELDRRMGFAPLTVYNPSRIEANRFIHFRFAEPDSPLGHAALARWFHGEGEFAFALELLDMAAETLTPEQQSHPFYLSALVAILIDLGEFDRADDAFEQWSAPRTGRDYWMTRGRIMQEVRDEPAEAVETYKHVLSVWPGPVDWRTINRKAHCLARIGDQEGATRERERAKFLEGLMDEAVHQRLRFVLTFLGDSEMLKEVEDFYRQIGRTQEADCWAEHINRLNEQPAGG